MMRKVNQIRLANLEILIAEAGSATKLARAAGTNSSYLSQVRNQLPTRKGTPRAIGDNLAEKLEKSMKKIQGWMDTPHTVIADKTRAADQTGTYPIISWVEARNWSKIAENPHPIYGGERIHCPIRCSPTSYVLRVHGSSMEPKFVEGDLLFVDPNVAPTHGKYVVVRLGNAEEASFKQLIVEDGKQYLKALNPDWPNRILEVSDDAFICGVVIFKGEVI
jgi:SOS-response transcriptional repressor LexA